jgi:hypothetical protein
VLLFGDTPCPYPKETPILSRKQTKRLALFAAGLGLVFAAAAVLGSAVEPADTEAEGVHAMSEEDGGPMAMADGAAGLAVSAEGLTLRLRPAHLKAGESHRLRFQIVDSDGTPVTAFERMHARRMHLIVVRRDGSGFRHLHPEMDEAGTWETPVGFDRPGVYRAFADFSLGGRAHTLATDLFVAGGAFSAAPFPPPASLASTDGYRVALSGGDPRAGSDADLTFTVSRDGAPVDGLAPYLGARGHLVALREGDLAFLHVHPEEHAASENEISFGVSFPSAGRYRLYLQFRHGGAVHTAEFTVEVGR